MKQCIRRNKLGFIFIFITAFAVLLPGVNATLTNVDSLCNQAEYLLFNHHLHPAYLDSAYRLLACARQLNPRHEKCLYLWSRVHTQQGENTPSKNERLRLFERARAIAETLQMLNPHNPHGYMWWAVAQGRIGQTRGVLNSLFMVPDIKRAFNRVLELDPEYPAAYDGLGVVYYELPGWAGGDLKKAEYLLIQGLKYDPNYTVIRLDLARVYLKQGRREHAREQLKLLLKTACPTCPADFYLEDRPAAEKLLQEIERRK